MFEFNPDTLMKTTTAPVSESERLVSIDILRGIALLGILLMNIPFFAMPDYFAEDWKADPGTFNFWLRAFITVLFEGKMRALFSMIFGVSILLFTSKKDKAAGLYYRRMGWLIVFGLIDAHLLLWLGDILFLYGVCGMIVFLFRKVKPLYLSLGVPLVAITGFVAGTFIMLDVKEKRLAYKEATEAKEQGKALSAAQEKAMEEWRNVEKELIPNKEDAKENTRLMKGSYADVASYVRPHSLDFQTKYLLYSLWDPIALMLLGIALYKWGYFTTWTSRRHRLTVFFGYALGLPLVILHFWYNTVNYPNYEASMKALETEGISWISLTYDFQRIFLVMAHVSLVLLLIRNGKVQRFFRSMAAVGRMAFTNYIGQTVICTLIFFGYGLNYYAELSYGQIFLVVLGVWIFQTIFSTVWLKYYHFGPLEWVWRVLTYMKRPPFKRE